MKLKQGDKAPDFRLKNTTGKFRSLKDYKGKILVLYFYPKDDTPGCTKEACSLRDSYMKLKKLGIEVAGVSPDSGESHRKFTEKFSLPFELFVDSEKAVAKKYGVWGKKKFMGREYTGVIRTTFIIENGKIRNIIEDVDTGNHAEQILGILGYKNNAY